MAPVVVVWWQRLGFRAGVTGGRAFLQGSDWIYSISLLSLRISVVGIGCPELTADAGAVTPVSSLTSRDGAGLQTCLSHPIACWRTCRDCSNTTMPLLKKSHLRLFLEPKLPPNSEKWEACYSVCINGSKSPGFRSLCWKENLLTFRDKIFSQLLWICQRKYNSLVFKVLGRKSEWNLLRSE